MEFDEEELHYLRNAVDLFNAHIRATTDGREYAAPTIRLGEELLARLWSYEPVPGAPEKASDDGRAG